MDIKRAYCIEKVSCCHIRLFFTFSTELASVECYNDTQDEWTYVADMTVPRQKLGVAVVGSKYIEIVVELLHFYIFIFRF